MKNNNPLKAVLVASLLAIAGGASAGPTLQHCKPMELRHSSTMGMAYKLNCSAQQWEMTYEGSVPAGTGAVTAQYNLNVINHHDGTSFDQIRSVRLLSPAHLGQTLLREAIILPGGELALRECKEVDCSKYRTLGDDQKFSKATITVTPAMKQLQDEVSALSGTITTLNASIAAKDATINQLEQDKVRLTESLAKAQVTIDGLEQSSQAADTQAQALISDLTIQIQNLQIEVSTLKADLERNTAQVAADRLKLEKLESVKIENQLKAQSELDKAQEVAQLAGAEHQQLLSKLAQANAQLVEAKTQSDIDQTLIQGLRTQVQLLNAAATQAADQYRKATSAVTNQEGVAAAVQHSADVINQHLTAQLKQVAAENTELKTKLDVAKVELDKALANPVVQAANITGGDIGELISAYDKQIQTLELEKATAEQLTHDAFTTLNAMMVEYQAAVDASLKLSNELEEAQASQVEVRKELENVRNLLTMANAKVDAAHLARDLAMQAADVAHLDADTTSATVATLQQTLKQKDARIQQLTLEVNQKTNPISREQTFEQLKQEISNHLSANSEISRKYKAAKTEGELRAILDEVLPEYHALRHLREKADAARDAALTKLKEYQKDSR